MSDRSAMVVVNRSSHSSIAALCVARAQRECPRVLGCVALAAVEAAR